LAASVAAEGERRAEAVVELEQVALLEGRFGAVNVEPHAPPPETRNAKHPHALVNLRAPKSLWGLS
jgi:hypothetical protein